MEWFHISCENLPMNYFVDCFSVPKCTRQSHLSFKGCRKALWMELTQTRSFVIRIGQSSKAKSPNRSQSRQCQLTGLCMFPFKLAMWTVYKRELYVGEEKQKDFLKIVYNHQKKKQQRSPSSTTINNHLDEPNHLGVKSHRSKEGPSPPKSTLNGTKSGSGAGKSQTDDEDDWPLVLDSDEDTPSLLTRRPEKKLPNGEPKSIDEDQVSQDSILEQFAKDHDHSLNLDSTALPKWLYKYLVFRFNLLDRTGNFHKGQFLKMRQLNLRFLLACFLTVENHCPVLFLSQRWQRYWHRGIWIRSIRVWREWKDCSTGFHYLHRGKTKNGDDITDFFWSWNYQDKWSLPAFVICKFLPICELPEPREWLSRHSFRVCTVKQRSKKPSVMLSSGLLLG